MPKQETMRGLERGLHVLEALEAQPISSLHDLHLATGIPKPSLLRVLQTLERFPLVSRRLGDGRWRASTCLSRAPRRQARHDRVAEAAAPVLDRLCQKVSWPSDLLVPAGDHLLIAETSRTHTPFPISGPARIGVRVNWLLSAVGTAYLAYCPEREREQVLRRLRQSDRPEDRLAREPRQLDKILAETRKRGYGVRMPGFVATPQGTVFRDAGLAAIAVPLLDGSRVHGSINVIWTSAAASVDAFAERHLADLQNAAQEILNSVRAEAGVRLRR
jgi:IclR family mhp operon transcriptional activator